MKARIVKPQSMYYGEVYCTLESMFGYESTKWHRVTSACFTEAGARRELKEWKKKHFPEEFEL